MAATLDSDPVVPTRRPLHTLLEWRALLELGALPLCWPMLRSAPSGDGHPVLLIPGFVAGEATLVPLAVFLKSRGYAVETWGLGRNLGYHKKFSRALEQKIRFTSHKQNRRVSIIGWSLGGVFAFDAAHAAPECVRTVVSLGSPMKMSPRGNEAPLAVRAMYRYLGHPMGPVAHLAHARAKLLRSPPPVPSTCIYSTADGVVPGAAAIIEGDWPHHENIRVPGSHLGLGINALVLWILAERLAQPEGDWHPFRPEGRVGSIYARLAALPDFL